MPSMTCAVEKCARGPSHAGSDHTWASLYGRPRTSKLQQHGITRGIKQRHRLETTKGEEKRREEKDGSLIKAKLFPLCFGARPRTPAGTISISILGSTKLPGGRLSPVPVTYELVQARLQRQSRQHSQRSPIPSSLLLLFPAFLLVIITVRWRFCRSVFNYHALT